MDTKLQWNQLHRSELRERRWWAELSRKKEEMRYRGGQGTAKLTYTVNSSILSVEITSRIQILLREYFLVHTQYFKQQNLSLVTGCKCPNNTQNNRRQGWLQQWYRSVPALPVFTRKRQLLKCSCTLAITEILWFVTIIKSQGPVLSSQTGQLKDKQDFHSCSSDGHHPVYRRKSLQLAVHTGPTLNRFLLLFPLLCCHSYCDYRYLSCLCSPRSEREGRYHFWQLYFGSPSTHWFGQQYLRCRLLPEASCIS